MAVLVQKTFSTVCTGQLHQAITDNVTIVTVLEQIVYAGGATTDFWFANALSGPEDTELDNILGSWSCAAEPVESGDGYLDDSNGPSTDILWSSQKITDDFAANSITITGGGILSGGGDLTANRVISLAHADVDHDQTTNTHNLTTDIDHDQLTNYVANEHATPKNSIEIDTAQLQLDGDAASPGTDKLYGTNGSGVKGWYDIPAGASGEINTASNLGAGVGVFDGKVGVDLQFRSLVSQNTLLSITLDGANDEIDFTVNVGNIDHDSLLNTHNLTTDIDHDQLTNYAANEHIDHTSVTLTAGLGLSGGGDISANRNFAVNVANSIEISGDNVQLMGDAASPGNDKLYGTNGSGTKGWYDQPAGAGGDVTAASTLTDHALIRGDGGAKGVQDSGWILDDSDDLDGSGVLKAQTEVRVKHPTDSNQDIIFQSGTGYSTIGSSISKPGPSGFLHMMPNSASVQWIIADPASATGVNAFYWDVDTQGTMYLNTLPGAGRTGDVVATHTAALRPAADLLSTLGAASYRWGTIYGQHADLTGNITITGTVDGRDVALDGTNQDTHIADGTIHFTEASIDHDSITNTHNLTTDIDHDQLTNFVVNEHLDWTADQGANNIHDNNIVASSVTQHVGSIDHDSLLNTHNLTTDIDHDLLTNFVANEHIDHTSVTLTAGAGLAGGGDISANRSFSVNVQNSIEISTDTLQLVNDAATPGNNQVYGTDGAGVKGWKADPAGGGGDVTAAANLVDNSIIRGDGGVKGVQDSDSLWTIADDGLMAGVVNRSGHAMTIRNNNATTGEFLRFIASDGSPSLEFNKNTNEDGIWRAYMGVSGNAFFEADFGVVKIGDTANPPDINYELLIDHGVLGISNALDDKIGIQAPAGAFTDYTLTLPTSDGNLNEVLTTNGSGVLSWTAPGTGDVSGPGSSVDTRIPRWDGTTGTLLQNPDAGTDLFFTDAGEFNIVTDTTLYGLYITNNTAGGDFINLQNHNSNDLMLVKADASGNGSLEVFTDAGGIVMAADSTGINTAGTYKIGGVTVNIPSGGIAGQVIEKVDGTDYNVQWATPTVYGDVSAAANMTDNSIIRGDGGVKGVQDSDGTGLIDWTISDSGKLVGVGDLSGDYVFTVRNLNATSGNGFSVQAGEALGDIAFHIADSDDSFQIMEMEADQGYVIMGKTYAQTLSDNGVVYGLDNQHPSNANDFNTQTGQYRMAGDPIILNRYAFYADQVEFPRGTDWDVNVGAPASADSNNSAIVVRRFDDTTQEAVGFIGSIPSIIKEMNVQVKGRAETAPGVAQNVVLRLHWRAIPDNAAVGTWTSVQLGVFSVPTNEFFQFYSLSQTLTTWGLTAGTSYQWQLSRDAGNGSDNLTGDWAMLEVELEMM